MATKDMSEDVFDELLEIDPSEAAAELAVLLAEVPDDRRDVADERAVQLLENRQIGDALLEHMDLEVLASLGERLIRLQSPERPRFDDERRWAAWAMLDILRRPQVLGRIVADGVVAEWSDRVLRLVESSNFTFGPLFEQRVAGYGPRTLFELNTPGGVSAVSWVQAAGRVGLIARGLLQLGAGAPERPLAILSENRLEMALTDLACLTTGIVDVMIPATATDAEVAYILEHCGAGAVVVSDTTQLRKVAPLVDRLPALEQVVAFDPAAARRNVLSFDELLGMAGEIPSEEVGERRASVSIGDLATVMYTSGTTGQPKGIRFSQRNVVMKRFARALALPEIGENDRFLSYLPLYHTFGRFLELCGTIFWGATYRFADSPAIDSLVAEMQAYRPTVLISIPMKWFELHERIRSEVDLATAPDDEILECLRRTTGGALRWGLSAAGYLDPEVFRFFQRYGVELMSGFGMTEATGGITMTPPGCYEDDSIGLPLPGIEIDLADDGELVIRGPYVMMGYLDDPDGAPSFDDRGWFHTGDVMERDQRGHLRIVDRKKEIYKNVKGQTIAPQKIENLFRDFESVGRIFLVGDHRAYNTALIVPNLAFEEIDLSILDAAEKKAHFRSLVVSANSFLAPFERIVDFAVVDRDFDPELGELTPKGTYRRKTIERNFADTIKLLYQRTTLTVGGAEIIVPNWLFQALGITSQELEVDGDHLTLGSIGEPLSIRALPDGEIQVGSVVYGNRGRGPLDLGRVLSTPLLWLGNYELVDFAPLDAEHRDRRRRREEEIRWRRRVMPRRASEADRRAVAELATGEAHGLMAIHSAAGLLDSDDPEIGMAAVGFLSEVVEHGEGELIETVLAVLRHAAAGARPEVIRRAFQELTVTERPTVYPHTLAAFLTAEPKLFGEDTVAFLNEHELSPEIVRTLIDATERHFATVADEAGVGASLIRFLAQYGACHPARYRQLRAFITRMSVTASGAEETKLARRARVGLDDGFRGWLGPTSRIAVDSETGLEYRWDDVVAFSEDVDTEAKHRLLAAIKSTTMLQEGIFLASRGTSVRLDDILPGGVWVRHLGTEHGKSVYRVAVKTRTRGHFDLAVNLNRDLSHDAVLEEIDWLVVCSEERDIGPLVEEFGGYWPEHGLWTEEFIPGETLDRALARLSRRDLDRQRLETLWPFAAWSAMSAYVDFWNRTGRRLVVADPSPGNVIVPTHDYHTGARLVSIASRRPFTNLYDMLQSFRRDLLAPVEVTHPHLRGLVDWSVLFSSVLEIVGESEGRDLLEDIRDLAADSDPALTGALDRYLESVTRRGFLPRRLFFAAKRFQKWDRLAYNATHTVRARTLQELYETYRLADLRHAYPESRARFFRETVFHDVAEPLALGLDTIISDLRVGVLRTDDLSSAVSDLRAQLDLEPENDYFLARLSYPYLQPEDEAEYVAAMASGVRHSEIVVTYDDPEGRPYRIRHALNPKEIARLHRLFLAAKLPVQFRPEHRFLVAVSDRRHLLGGLFYEVQPETQSAHMDKVVVTESARGHGVAGHLIEELANRLRAESYRWLTTGFFRPQFFYRYGFTVERRYAGLVRELHPEAEDAS